MGGLIGSYFANTYPDMVEKLILLAPAIVPVPLPFTAKLVTAPLIGGPLFKVVGKSGMLDKLKRDRFKDDFAHPEKYPNLINGLVARIQWQIEHKKGFVDMFHSTLSNFPLSTGRVDIVGQVNARGTPILLLWGDKDISVPFDVHSKLLEVAPQIKFKVIEDAGHALNYEAVETLDKEILQFLK